MNIAVDVDGVLADFTGRIREVYGLGPYFQTEWNDLGLPKGVPEETFWQHMVASPEFYSGVKPYSWAFDLVERLKRTGHKFFFATSCSPGSVPHKAAWLARYFGDAIPAIYFTFGTDKMLYDFDLLIDDKPGLEYHPKVLPFPHVYNRAFKDGHTNIGDRRIAFWDAFRNRIEEVPVV